jgi:hypothetical protein
MVFTAEGQILHILRECSENAMIVVEIFLFDKVSNDWINLNYIDGITISFCKKDSRM